MEKLDLTKILKDCPKRTEFYSRCMGTVYFDSISELDNTIVIITSKGVYVKYNKTGKYSYSNETAEIDLFPSKDERDWSKWHRPFVDGDILVSEAGNIVLCSHIDEKQLVHYHCLLNFLDILKIRDDIGVGYSYKCTLANDSQKQRLFDALKKHGYEWDEEEKVLKKIELKFDINTLQPFDRVLVRSNNSSVWGISHFAYINNDFVFRRFICENNATYIQCIHYNEETKHLLGIMKKAPEKYINW